MGLERSMSQAMYQTYGPGLSTGTGSECYIEPGPLAEVLVDQLRYLIGHKSAACPSDCADCERLAGTQSWLLLPFRATATQGWKPPVNPAVADPACTVRL